ncbi:MAG: hypothetical protein KDA68_07755, partial [Planctomycetaceae bacterium]|nr:hypothetical protein [Planctomycetaceae bacterium]
MSSANQHQKRNRFLGATLGAFTKWGFLVAAVILSGCDFLKIEEESTNPQPVAPPPQTAAPPPAPVAPPAPPVVPPEKVAEQIIKEFYNLNPQQVNDQALQKLASIYDPAKETIDNLNLQSSGVTDNSFESIKKFPNLKNLNMAMTHITKDSMINLRDLDNLEIVNLGHTPADNEVVKLLAGIPTIRSLDLNETRIDDHALGILDTFENLERLSVAGVASIDGGGFRGARKLANLKSLVLNRTGIVDQAIPIIAKYPLEELHMSACYLITDRGIARLTGMKELKYLNLRDNNSMTNRGLAKVAS